MVAVIAALFINKTEGVSPLPAFPAWLWLFACLIGLFFIANFFIFSKSTHRNGVGVSVSAMRLSLVVPVLVSVLLFNETVTILRGIGMVLVMTALALLIASRKDVKPGMINSHWLLFGVFLLTGLADASFKIFEQKGLPEGTEAQFLSVVFFSSFVFGMMAAGSGLKKISLDEIKMGIFIGLPNLLTTLFLIKALSHADGVFVYPAVNILIIIGGALIGKLYWDDKISLFEAAGMVMAVIAILLLL